MLDTKKKTLIGYIWVGIFSECFFFTILIYSNLIFPYVLLLAPSYNNYVTISFLVGIILLVLPIDYKYWCLLPMNYKILFR